MSSNRFGIKVVALGALADGAVVDRHHGVGLELDIVKDQLVLAVPTRHVNLDDVYVEVRLGVELGLALRAAVVPPLGGHVSLVMPLMDFKLLAFQVKLSAAVHLANVLGLDVVHNGENIFVLMDVQGV